jgi:hypothetical protein
MSKISKIGLTTSGLPPGINPSNLGANSAPGNTPDITDEEREQLGRILKAALKAVDTGIDIGMKRDFATSHGGVVNTLFSKMLQGLSILLYPGSGLESITTGDPIPPPRHLERRVRNRSTLMLNNSKINVNSKEAFQDHVIRPATGLYNSNFGSFMDIIKKNPKFKAITVNDTSELQVLAIEFKSADTGMRTTSDESPYRIILKRLIPRLREKFDAIVTFKEKVGEGSNIDFEGIGNSFGDGSATADDIAHLEGLYKAIDEWNMFCVALSVSGSVRESKKEDEEEGEGEDDVSLEAVLKGVSIRGIRPGNAVGYNQDGSGDLLIDKSVLQPTNVPTIKVVLEGSMVGHVNSVGKAQDYFDYFEKNNQIKIMAPGSNTRRFISDISRETVHPKGAELTIYFNPTAISGAIGSGATAVDIMAVRTQRGDLKNVVANDKSLLDDLVKLSGATSTTPLYETVSPSGENVAFTPADLVLGGGSLTDSKGNKFKYKKRKGKSLAGRVNSKDFGKVKRGLKNK